MGDLSDIGAAVVRVPWLDEFSPASGKGAPAPRTEVDDPRLFLGHIGPWHRPRPSRLEKPSLAPELVLAPVDRLGALGDEDQLEALEPDHQIRDAYLSLVLEGVEIIPAGEVMVALGLPNQPGGHQQGRLIAVHGTADLRGVLARRELLVQAVRPVILHRPVEHL